MPEKAARPPSTSVIARSEATWDRRECLWRNLLLPFWVFPKRRVDPAGWIGGKVSGFAALYREIATGHSALAMTLRMLGALIRQSG